MKTTKLTEKELLEMGFVKKPLIISPSRVWKDDELFLGQIDENGERKDLLVYRLPRGFRFNKDIVVNYRNEILIVVSGFMAGGIEAHKDLDNSNIYFRETETWREEVQKLISTISD